MKRSGVTDFDGVAKQPIEPLRAKLHASYKRADRLTRGRPAESGQGTRQALRDLPGGGAVTRHLQGLDLNGRQRSLRGVPLGIDSMYPGERSRCSRTTHRNRGNRRSVMRPGSNRDPSRCSRQHARRSSRPSFGWQMQRRCGCSDTDRSAPALCWICQAHVIHGPGCFKIRCRSRATGLTVDSVDTGAGIFDSMSLKGKSGASQHERATQFRQKE
jgi:hypothetical protein